jgi:hypothetical protein
MNRHTLRRLLIIVTVAVLLVSVAATLAACGSGGTGNNAGGDVSTYTDKTYGFSFGYPSDWKLQEAADQADVTSGAAPTTVVAAYDPDGAKTDTSYCDLVEVSVYKLNVVVDDSMMPEVQAEVEATFADLEAQAADLKVVEAMSEVSMAGIKGWKITYQYDKEGTPAESTLYLLFSGDLEYQLLVQAATENWQADQPAFQAFLSSFKPGAGSATTSSTSD